MTLRPLLFLGLFLVLAPAVGASQGRQTICCRSSGGTRGACLNLWAHLVPPNNRFDPGPRRLIALLQGPSLAAASMRVQLFRQSGELFVDETLPAQGATVWLLLLPKFDRQDARPPLVWESFPNCGSSKPPTRTLLETGSSGKPAPGPLAPWGESCGKEVATAPLLRAFGLEEWGGEWPTALPVHCLPLTAVQAPIPPPPRTPASP